MGKSRSSEKLISKHCSDIGATAAEPDEDIFGWDLFVQFPEDPFKGAAEDRPERSFAYVQVKSTEKGKASAKIKMSNVREAATSSAPWFFFMVMEDETIRAKHLWGDLLEKWLKLVRKAGVEGSELHAEKISLNFAKNTTIPGNVADWMRTEIRKVGEDYAKIKKGLIENLGYQKGYGGGKLLFADMTMKHLASTFLGLKKNVPVSGFSFTKSRFEIPDAYPTVDNVGGSITFDPRPASDCDIRLQGQGGEPPITLKGDVYGFRLPNSGSNNGYLRFSASPLEIVRSPDGTYEISLTFEPTKRYPLRQWLVYEKLTRWSEGGPISIRISKSAKVFVAGNMNLDATDQSQVEILCFAINAIEQAVRASGVQDPNFSDEDFGKSFGDVYRFCMAFQPELSVVYPQDEPVPPFHKMICRTRVDFDHLAIHCFLSREVVSDEMVGGERVFTAGQPTITEAHIYSKPNATALDAILADYELFSEGFDDSTILLNFGDINTSIQRMPDAI
ncbi:hypothetical protein ELG69_29020 [Rhizobium leguminosarum]|uniref:hypothetical protein n=1 Tax=Rhizobium leguminosarum TaxID=384 RepID=UPI001031C798|nr:hypothetical protein [Rhizobium leguminosarum]TBG74387.1 hypothetical protein ELG69_29020 [Rhizobium leguminosarum]